MSPTHPPRHFALVTCAKIVMFLQCRMSGCDRRNCGNDTQMRHVIAASRPSPMFLSLIRYCAFPEPLVRYVRRAEVNACTQIIAFSRPDSIRARLMRHYWTLWASLRLTSVSSRKSQETGNRRARSNAPLDSGSAITPARIASGAMHQVITPLI
jgi:hypothetical protein